jgi:hypothetical protein
MFEICLFFILVKYINGLINISNYTMLAFQNDNKAILSNLEKLYLVDRNMFKTYIQFHSKDFVFINITKSHNILTRYNYSDYFNLETSCYLDSEFTTSDEYIDN